MPCGFECVEAFFKRFPRVRNIDRTNLSELMQLWNPSFYDLSDSYCLVDGSPHAFQGDTVVAFFLRDYGSC